MLLYYNRLGSVAKTKVETLMHSTCPSRNHSCENCNGGNYVSILIETGSLSDFVLAQIPVSIGRYRPIRVIPFGYQEII